MTVLRVSAILFGLVEAFVAVLPMGFSMQRKYQYVTLVMYAFV